MRAFSSHISFIALALAASLLLPGCGRSEGDAREGGLSEEGILAEVGRQRLSIEDVRADMPGGFNEEDSARFVNGYVSEWVDTRLLDEMASDEIDMEQIERLVSQYRASLIADAYRRKIVAESADASFAEDSLMAYYDARKSDFRLRAPMVNGVYLKLPEKASNLGAIRRLMRSDAPDDIDRLEKEAVNARALHYDYFRERWVDWDRIETRIPYSFGDIKEFLRPGRFLETRHDGYIYLLRITEVLPSGSIMPYEAARDEVRERMMAARHRELTAAFHAELLKKALDSGKAKIYI